MYLFFFSKFSAFDSILGGIKKIVEDVTAIAIDSYWMCLRRPCDEMYTILNVVFLGAMVRAKHVFASDVSGFSGSVLLTPGTASRALFYWITRKPATRVWRGIGLRPGRLTTELSELRLR